MSITAAIIEKGTELAILKNNSVSTVKNQGVLFSHYLDENGDTRDEAWVVTNYAIVRWSDCGKLDFPENRPFFSYSERDFVENDTSFKDIRKLRKLYEEGTAYYNEENIRRGEVDVVPIPVNNLARKINNLYDDRMKKIERSRTIFKNNNGFVFEKELTLKYDASANRFFHESLDIRFFPHKASNLTPPYKDGQVYRTVILDEGVVDGEEVGLIDVRDEYFKGIEIGIHEVFEGTYFPESEKEILDFSLYPEDRILRYQYPVEPASGSYSFSPILIETPALFYVLRIMEGFDFFDMYIDSSSRVRPVLMVSVKNEKTKDNPLIEVIMGPLRPEIRGYHL